MNASENQILIPRAASVGAGVFLGVFLLRQIVLVRLTDSQFLLPASGDMQFYNNWALRILGGEWTTHAAFYGLPLYAYLLAAIYKICGYSPFVPGLMQAGLEAGTAVLLYKLGSFVFVRKVVTESAEERLLGAKAIGLLAALGWAFFRPAEAYSVILMPASWMVFIFWFVVWQIVKSEGVLRFWRLFLLSGMIGFAAMGIATVLFLVPLLVAALCLRGPGATRRWLTGAVLILAGVFAGASPAWMHNYFVARDPVFLSAHGGVNFWIGNNPVANGYPKFPPGLRAGQAAMLEDSITTVERTVGHPLKRSEVSAFWLERARAWIRQDPAAWLELLGLKIKNFWNAFQYDDISVITALQDQSIILPGIGFGIVAAFGLPGLLIASWKIPKARWIAAAVLVQMVSLLTVFVTERYRLAAVPGLLLFAAFGIWELWRNLATGRLWESAVFLILLFCATGFVSLPQKDPGLWALDTYNSGLQAFAAGNLALARQKLDRAYAYTPYNAEINLAEGNLRLAQGNIAGAKDFYLRSLQLDPRNKRSYNNLGILALKESHLDLAVKFFRKALEENPHDPKTFYLLAQAHFQAGDLTTAHAMLEQAIKLKADQPEFLAFREEMEKTMQSRNSKD